MVDYSIPFANAGEKREPNSSEIDNGFTCGGADRLLFNWLEYARQAEIGEVISYAGIVGSNSDMTQLRQAIQRMINAALAGIVFNDPNEPIDTSGFLLMSQARARLPIYPFAQTTDGKLPVDAGSGQVSLVSGNTFLHRGIFQVTTPAQNFATSANKIYHLRWSSSSGYALRDLSDSGYNSGAQPEYSAVFDSSYDDMLIARVVTNESNVSTITTLINKPILSAEQSFESPVNDSLNYTTIANSAIALNWARTPTLASLKFQLIRTTQDEISGLSSLTSGFLKTVAIAPVSAPSRYSTGNVKYSYEDSSMNGGRIGFSWTINAR